MILTEEEAKTKWCPFARAVRGDGVSGFNRGSDMMPDAGALCIASQCMAFRWAPDAFVELKDGRKAVVDQGDWSWVKSVSWWWDGRYAKRESNGYLHRDVIEMNIGPIPDGMFIDHRDGDPLNNRLGNLRLVTPAQNAANSAARGGKSQYRGVFQQANGRWSAQISRLGKRLCLGTYDTEEEAAAAYDTAAKEVHGEHARLNLEALENSGRRGFCGLAGRV